MKKLMFGITLALVPMVTGVYAFGPSAKDANQTKLPGVVMVKPTKSACVTQVKGRATQVKIPVAGAAYVNWYTDNGSGTGVVVKRSFDNSVAGSYAPGLTKETGLAIGPGIKQVILTNYTTPTDKTICYETDN